MSEQKMQQAIDIIDKFGVLKYRAGCSTEKTSVELLEQAHAYRHQLHELLAEISAPSTPSAGAAVPDDVMKALDRMCKPLHESVLSGVTSHAAQRWDERFPGQSLVDTFARAKCRVGKKTRAKIRASCPAHDDFMRGSFKGIYYQMTPEHIVFVIQPPEKIITVFKLEKP